MANSILTIIRTAEYPPVGSLFHAHWLLARWCGSPSRSALADDRFRKQGRLAR